MPAQSTGPYRSWQLLGVLLALLLSPPPLGATNASRLAHPLTRLTAADAADGDQFSVAVAAHGRTVLVGAFWDDDDGSASGSAYLYAPNDSGAWIETQKLTAPDAAANDWFGVSVGIHGDWALVGAPLQDEAAMNGGAAYLFRRDPSNPDQWLPVQKLVASNAGANDWFGWEVALSEELIAIGAYQHDSAGTDAGAIYVFRRQPDGSGLWTESGKLTAPEARPGAWLGFSLAVYAENILAGAPFDSPGGISSGAAYLFSHDPATDGQWQTTCLFPNPPYHGQQFGWSVALHDRLAAVGARLTDHASSMGGAVYLYQASEPSEWTQIDVVVSEDNAANDWFGEALALSENLLAIGVRLDDDQGHASGSTYLFQPTGAGPWRQTQKLLAHDGDTDFRFGESIAIHQDLLVVGSFADDSHGFGYAAGAAYLYELQPANPILTVTHSAQSVSLSWDPPVLAVLEHSTDLVKWTVLPASLPPVLLPNEAAMRFYRLRAP